MRIRAWAALGAVVLALVLGFTAEAADQRWIFVVAGVAWVVAIVLGVSLLPFWRRVLPKVTSMPHLFRRPADGERWCTTCGSPTASRQKCSVCGAPPKQRKSKAVKASKA